MRFIGLLCLGLMLFASEYKIGIVNTDLLNVRECDMIPACPVVGNFRDGDVIYLEYRTQRGWYKVKDTDMFVHGDYIKIVASYREEHKLAMFGNGVM